MKNPFVEKLYFALEGRGGGAFICISLVSA